MSSILRKLLGVGCRLATEEITPTAAATEDTTVVVQGPLADVYSDALLKTYDKEDGGAGELQAGDPAANPEPAAETGEEVKVDVSNLTPKEGETAETVEAAVVSEIGNIVLESQAIDAAVAQSLAQALSDGAPEDGSEFETLYAVDQSMVQQQDVKDVTAILAETDKPENVTVLIDDVVPEAVVIDGTPEVVASQELAVALESMVIAMGGRVVHSFPEYLKSRKK